MIKYVCWSGDVISSDGQLHHISAHRLPELYGVPYNECIFCDYERPETYLGKDMTFLTGLYPRNDGNYKLPDRLVKNRKGLEGDDKS